MNSFVILMFTLNTLPLTNAKPTPFTFYHQNYSTFVVQTSYSSPQQITMIQPLTALTNDNQSQRKLVFPDSHATQTRSTAIDGGGNCIHGFCETADNYPEEYIKSVLNRTKIYDSFFKPITFQFDNRFKGEEINNLCRSSKNTSYPKTAFNSKQLKRTIANVEGYRQGVVMEICAENAECEFSDIWPIGYTSVCEQKFTELNLLVLDADGQIVVDRFSSPSCCTCMYKKG